MTERLTLPVLPLREFVLFPGVTSPIQAGKPATLRAIEAALNSPEHLVFAVSQREDVPVVTPEALHTIGTVARIGQVQRGFAGMQLLLAGEYRGIAMRISEKDGYLHAIVREAEEMLPLNDQDAAFVGLFREARQRAAELGKKSGLPDEVVHQVLEGVNDPSRFADLVAAYTDVTPPQRQMLLETLSVEERLRRVLVHVQRQLKVLEAQEDIKSRVQEELGDRQREMFLREQLKAIQKELGEGDETGDVDELREKLTKLQLPPAVRKEVDREMARLKRAGREGMEAQVIRTYLETIAELPWNERSVESLSIPEAARILEEDHYALGDVKDRVLEFLAVRQLRQAANDARRAKALAEAAEAGEANEAAKAAEGEPAGGEDAGGGTPAAPAAPLPPGAASPDAAQPTPTVTAGAAPKAAGAAPKAAGAAPKAPPTGDDLPGNEDDKGAKGPILLFVGPPGVGKTSVAKSIARAMGREYIRVSLGGVRDEADIRGHRRTYVGAMPGRIIQGMKQAGTKNPVFLLDEVDKLGVSFQGDPAAGLLEVLDPAQNDTFTDHYLGVPFDLSEVLFIATANFIQNIPGPLLDRMEVVQFAGYTEQEKLIIARRYLVPRQVAENGLTGEQLTVTDEAIAETVTSYTREAGVRQLEREIGRLARKVARRIAAHEIEATEVGAPAVRDLLGRPKVHPERAAGQDAIGTATGMYYTPTGGDIMFVEAQTMRGKGELVLTGQLGDVMKESARAAWSYARSHATGLGIKDERFDRDMHIHVPAGAIPKDGPSAGVTMATAMVSALSERPARHDIAMTGEITLSGRVLPIGGVKEKVLGAVRAGIRTVLIPKDNEADLEDLPREVRESLQIFLAEDLGEVLALTLRGASYKEGRLLFGDHPEAPAAAETPLAGDGLPYAGGLH
ncbi:MAG TPA: endopeptidase La [Thermoanaerobaculia bacterium]|nr:endopeptidase La [Thermoanaerobaculia bacterium]